MDIFNWLFKQKEPTIAEVEGCQFTRTYSKRESHIWTTIKNDFIISIRGTETQPNLEQARFILNYEVELSKLDQIINKKFKSELTEADLPVDFENWTDRFKAVSADVMVIHNNDPYWNITFEDLKSPFYHFTLFIEGGVATDFSIDS